ncbi:MAG: hypothetical protein B7Y36_19015, partial [Novosphingobium sp. 28-62-57]|uniref:hypothetical protein n=1 Tax=Novosphingobium sp. 28-62-57 TaxID=1970409 RepID=UPI000BD7AA85
TATYRAWKLCNGVHYPLRIEGSTLKDAVADAQGFCGHKDQFVILEADEGKQIVRVYQIKQGKPEYRYVGGNAVRMAPMRAELVTEMQVEAYAPVEPWQWSPGADVVGRDGGEVVNA